MRNLIPEKRIDRNGKLVTKHVKADSSRSQSATGLPAPALTSKGQKPTRKDTFKPRPSQTEQGYYSFPVRNVGKPSPELQPDTGDNDERYYGFGATEVQMYDVLSVASISNGLKMLGAGVRTAEAAREYLRSHDAEHLIEDNRNLTNEALNRNIGSTDFVYLSPKSHPGQSTGHSSYPSSIEPQDTPYFMDTIELYSIKSLEGQTASISQHVYSGDIKLEDIKTLGVSRLKSKDRLVSSELALLGLNDPEAKHTIEDMKQLLTRANKEKSTKPEYSAALRYLTQEGPEFFDNIPDGKLEYLLMADSMHGSHPDSTQRVIYDFEFRNNEQQESPRIPTRQIMEMYEAGVPAKRAAELNAQGLDVRGVIAVEIEGTEQSLADGWL